MSQKVENASSVAPDEEKPTEGLAMALAKAGLTEALLARMTGVHRATIWRWVTGKVKPPKWAFALLESHIRTRKLLHQVVSLGELPAATLFGPVLQRATAPEISGISAEVDDVKSVTRAGP